MSRISDKDYQIYINTQLRRATRSQNKTRTDKTRRQWIYSRMQELNIDGKTVLCVGARHESEMDFFEEKGFEVEGIDLWDEGKMVKCDMSKMLEHPHFKNQRYDIVYSNESIEHCLDLDGFIKGLNVMCKKYFVCMCPDSDHAGLTEGYTNPTLWDCSVHKFQTSHDKYEEYLMDAFDQFKIIVAEVHRRSRLFFILEKK